MQINRHGNLLSFSNDHLNLIPKENALNNTPRFRWGNQDISCREPETVDSDPSQAVFVYSIKISDASVNIRYKIQLQPMEPDRVVLIQSIAIKSLSKIQDNFDFILPRVIQIPQKKRMCFAPLKNGVGAESEIGSAGREWMFYLTGSEPDKQISQLAIPMIDEFGKDSPIRLTFCADPYFSTLFRSPWGNETGAFQCTYEAKSVPFSDEERTFYTILHTGTAEMALDNFYRTALADIPPGPAWLHEIAMVDYDYLSDGGTGWFKDIDWLNHHIPAADHHRICLALHGWYDLLGRYAFDIQTHKMAPEWTAFPNAPQVLDRFPNSRSVKMTCEEVRRRLRYARERGFHAVLYFADGLAICEGVKERFSPEIILYSGGWEGPDTIGPTHIQNPLHPKVYQWYLDYMDALLQEFGNDTDGFVWDETFHVDPSHFGTKYAQGYAARAMMYLTRDLTQSVHRYRKDCVFLSSDCIGAAEGRWTQKIPCALMADGTYQDSHCHPAAWPYGLFPNYRNVLWSCNWGPVSHYDWTQVGVEKFQAPVAISNGYEDDKGISEMTDVMAQKIMSLFQQRKQPATRLRWLSSIIPNRKSLLQNDFRFRGSERITLYLSDSTHSRPRF